jgi:hypothetical protein
MGECPVVDGIHSLQIVELVDDCHGDAGAGAGAEQRHARHACACKLASHDTRSLG